MGLVLAAVLVIWPAWFNGQPFFYTDTSAYIRGADAGIEKITGISTQWSVPQSISPTGAIAPKATVETNMAGTASPGTLNSAPTRLPDVVLAGRSVYYGALLYVGYAAGNFWLTVLVQGMLVTMVTAMLLHSQGLLRPQHFSLATVLLCLTPASLYASLLMPDIFGGVTVAAGAALLFGLTSARRSVTVSWFFLLTAALLMHSSNVVVCAAIWAIAVLACLLTQWRPETLRGFVLVPLAILVALSGEAAFAAGVRHFLGDAPIRPPFLMARVIGDGTGEKYLRSHCATSDFTVCRFVDRLPLTADEFLWLEDPQRGVFSVSDAVTRRALANEQARFVLAAIANDPVGQIKASLRNSYVQLIALGASEFSYWDGDKPNYAIKLPRETWASMQKSRAFLGQIPVSALTSMTVVTTALGAFYLLLTLAFTLVRRRPLDPAMRLALLVAAGVLLNAMVCGSMSEPHNRYQARVIWLIPLVALLVDLDARREWWERALSLFRRSGSQSPLP